MLPRISQLFVYPVKSCAGIPVSSFQFDEKGPLFDRRWMLVDADTGIFLSQREIPQMALIVTRIDGDNVWVEQSSNEYLVKRHRLPMEGQLVDVDIWEECVGGYDCGDELANWFSQLLGRRCRLVYQGGCERLADEKYAEKSTQVSFADGFPLLVVAQSSIDVLNAEGASEMTASNFRPNIVIENTPAFAEIDWQQLVVCSDEADIEMAVVKRCQRCAIPLLNPTTAVRDPGVLPVLLKYCRENKEIYFGQNLTFKYQEGLLLKIGQNVRINDE